MICALCGGHVTWRGPLVALTHTQCGSCGERNCQEVDDESDDEEEAAADAKEGYITACEVAGLQ